MKRFLTLFLFPVILLLSHVAMGQSNIGDLAAHLPKRPDMGTLRW